MVIALLLIAAITCSNNRLIALLHLKAKQLGVQRCLSGPPPGAWVQKKVFFGSNPKKCFKTSAAPQKPKKKFPKSAMFSGKNLEKYSPKKFFGAARPIL